MTIEELIREAHETAKGKGWWSETPERTFPEQIALMHSELSEALEEYRQTVTINGEDKPINPYSTIYTTLWGAPARIETALNLTDPILPKPEGIATEFADVLIRIANTCAKYDIPLETALRMKLAYNKTRPHRHGGKKC